MNDGVSMPVSPEAWDEFLSDYPDAHLLQTRAWGELKSAFGWRAMYLAEEKTGALVLFRQLFFGKSLASSHAVRWENTSTGQRFGRRWTPYAGGKERCS